MLVFIDVDAAHDSGLRPAVHHLPVEIERRLGILPQGAVGQKAIQRRPGLGVDPGIVGIHLVGQIDVGPPHVQEAVGISARQLRGLLSIDHIVGSNT